MSTYRTTLDIDASPERVFEHFVKPALLVRWMGDYAVLDAQAGGSFAVDINGVLIRGHYVRLEHPRLIEIAWGELGNEAMPPASTQLRILLTPRHGGTHIELEHNGLLGLEADKHAMGWPHFLARLKILADGGDPGPDPWATPAPFDRIPHKS